jgi:peptidoglycan L-alanyl-D-glutamate endopeptidase CwlK
MDSISEQRLAQVYPVLADKIRQIAATLQPEGIWIRVTQALRTVEEQDALFAQGRTAPGKVVTNCEGGHSYHNYGLAVDCVPSLPGDSYIPDWNPEHPTWKRMEELGGALGLTVGALWRSFPDAPHFQISGRFPIGAPDDELRELFQGGGLEAVWNAVSAAP